MQTTTTLRFRTDTSANWTRVNPTLSEGEPGYETDTGRFKIGNGYANWNSLIYQSERGAMGPTGPTGPSILGNTQHNHLLIDSREFTSPASFNNYTIPTIPSGYNQNYALIDVFMVSGGGGGGSAKFYQDTTIPLSGFNQYVPIPGNRGNSGNFLTLSHVVPSNQMLTVYVPSGGQGGPQNTGSAILGLVNGVKAQQFSNSENVADGNAGGNASISYTKSGIVSTLTLLGGSGGKKGLTTLDMNATTPANSPNTQPAITTVGNFNNMPYTLSLGRIDGDSVYQSYGVGGSRQEPDSRFSGTVPGNGGPGYVSIFVYAMK